MASSRLCFGSKACSSFSISHHNSSLLSMKSGFGEGDKRLTVTADRKSVAAVAALEIVSTSKTIDVDVNLSPLLAYLQSVSIQRMEFLMKPRPWKLFIQMFIERVIIDCRFFTMFAVAGTLIGSVLCFVEGCFMMVESYFQYFHEISQKSDQGHVMHLLVEAIDMFVVGTAMVMFGMGLHEMFVASRNLSAKVLPIPASNFFGLFYFKKLPSWVGIQSITQAKSRIGHAMMMIMQVGVLDKFKSTPLVTGLDLACFAGAVFVSSACVFLLSKLACGVPLQDTITR